MDKIILVTPTYNNFKRLSFIKECIKIFSQNSNLFWILCEDNNEINIDVENLLKNSGMNYAYIAYGPTRDKGNEQRNKCYEYIVNNKLEGIVYNADDDNEYQLELFNEIRKTKNVSIFPVGNLGPSNIERPIVINGKVVKWDAGWLERKYPVDMGGFAFNSKFLYEKQNKNLKLWDFAGLGGESEFLCSIINDTFPIEFLCDNCRVCYVWHNELHKKF